MILAWAGLSAAWWPSDGVQPEIDFGIAELAAAELGCVPTACRQERVRAEQSQCFT